MYAVDVQAAMHDYYREKGVPENVELRTTEVSDLPLDGDSIDAAFSTMTYHEFASDDILVEIHRVLESEGVLRRRPATGPGEGGPPLDERFIATDASDTRLSGRRHSSWIATAA